MKIFVTGYRGRLGSQLVLLGCDPLACDITQPNSVKIAIEDAAPDVIINCAAFTHVDECETKEGFEKALKVNTEGVENLRNNFSGRLIHVSTDYIFSGKNGPYTEQEKKKEPVNAYGYTKWGAEIMLTFPIETDNKTCIIRTTGMYGGVSNRPDFASMLLDNLRQRKEVRITKELIGNQTYVPHIAEAILKLALISGFEYPVINIGSWDVISRYDFALVLAGVFHLDKSLIHPCRNDEIKEWVAQRPKKGGLKTSLAKRMGLPIYTILDGLKAYKNDTKQIS